MHWITPYVGLPYLAGGADRSGLDCWGLVRLVYEERFKIQLPILPGITSQSVLTICREIRAQVENDWLELERPIDGCAVAMSQRDAFHHVGIWVDADGGKIAHAWKDYQVIVETWKGLRWKGFKVKRYFWHGLHH